MGGLECEVSFLQYANDTIFVGDVNVKNVFTIKTILRMFELRVNFFKSCFGAIGVDDGVVERNMNGLILVGRGWCGEDSVCWCYFQCLPFFPFSKTPKLIVGLVQTRSSVSCLWENFRSACFQHLILIYELNISFSLYFLSLNLIYLSEYFFNLM